MDSRIPKRLEEYRQREYWDRRYEQDATGTYDWLMSYEQLRQLLHPLIQPTDRILNIGCGNSRTTPSTGLDRLAACSSSLLRSIAVTFARAE